MGGQMLEVVMSGRYSDQIHRERLIYSCQTFLQKEPTGFVLFFSHQVEWFLLGISFELLNIPVVILTSTTKGPGRAFVLKFPLAVFQNANHRAPRLNCSGVESGNLWGYSSISLLKLASEMRDWRIRKLISPLLKCICHYVYSCCLR